MRSFRVRSPIGLKDAATGKIAMQPRLVPVLQAQSGRPVKLIAEDAQIIKEAIA